MTVPGLLIEYLITGAFALAWVGGLCAMHPDGARFLKGLNAAHVTFLIPLAYILGTFIDYLGRELTRLLDKKRGHRGKHGTDEYYVKAKFCFEPPTIREEVIRLAGKEELFIRAPEAAKQYELRKARDRVARGVFTNFVIMDLVLLMLAVFYKTLVSMGALLVALACTLLSYAVWTKMVELSVKFKTDVSIEFLRQDERESLKKSASQSNSSGSA